MFLGYLNTPALKLRAAHTNRMNCSSKTVRLPMKLRSSSAVQIYGVIVVFVVQQFKMRRM